MATEAARLARNRGRKNKTGLNLAGPLLEGMWISSERGVNQKTVASRLLGWPLSGSPCPRKDQPDGLYFFGVLFGTSLHLFRAHNCDNHNLEIRNRGSEDDSTYRAHRLGTA